MESSTAIEEREKEELFEEIKRKLIEDAHGCPVHARAHTTQHTRHDSKEKDLGAAVEAVEAMNKADEVARASESIPKSSPERGEVRR